VVRSVWLVGSLVAALALPAPAAACATCGAGDPTLTLAGTEQPFAGRLRTSLSIASSGTSTSAAHTDERRLTLGAAWAPWSFLMLSAAAPLVWRDASTSSLAREGGVGPGDLDLRARLVVLRDRPFAAQHLVTLQLGARVPLAPALSDAQGRPLDDDAQTASRTLTPLVGLAWSFYAAPLSLQTYALLSIPTRGGDGLADPVELRAATLALVQVAPSLSLVVGPETRARLDATGASGGAVLFGTLGAMIGAGDVAPYVLVRIPVVASFGDGHRESLGLELGAAIDV
jgi:hypothetical protein